LSKEVIANKVPRLHAGIDAAELIHKTKL